VLVKNSGEYKRSPANGFGYAKTPQQVRKKVADEDARLLDVESYLDSKGRFRLAYLWIKNTGEAQKDWDWGAFLTRPVIEDRLAKKGMKLVRLQSIEYAGVRLWSFVAIKRTGVDAAATFPLYNATATYLEKQRSKADARIIDLDRRKTGRFDAVMAADDEPFDVHYAVLTRKRLGEIAASGGFRITDIEQYKLANQTFYAVTLRHNGDSEVARLRAIAWPVWNEGYFGVYAKIVGGPVIARLAHQSPYQPASTMKLVPHLYTLDRFDQGLLGSKGLDETMTWRGLKGREDDHACPDVSDSEVEQFSGTFREVLTRGLAESLGRSHEALLDWFGTDPPTGWNTAQWGAKTITEQIRRLGLTNTTMYPGCKSKNGRPYFIDSRTTLEDVGWLFEGVDTGTNLARRPESRREFYDLVANASVPDLFRQIATEEAGPERSDSVDPFLKMIGLEGKPGGLDPAAFPTKVTRAWSDHLLLPTGGGASQLTAVGGLFLNDYPMECHEDDPGKPGATTECKQFMKRHLDTWKCLYSERYRLAIREAIRTWPVNKGGPKAVDPGPRCGP
jgi:hypothetical protein